MLYNGQGQIIDTIDDANTQPKQIYVKIKNIEFHRFTRFVLILSSEIKQMPYGC